MLSLLARGADSWCHALLPNLCNRESLLSPARELTIELLACDSPELSKGSFAGQVKSAITILGPQLLLRQSVVVVSDGFATAGLKPFRG